MNTIDINSNNENDNKNNELNQFVVLDLTEDFFTNTNSTHLRHEKDNELEKQHTKPTENDDSRKNSQSIGGENFTCQSLEAPYTSI